MIKINKNLYLTVIDIKNGLINFNIWYLLSLQDIKQRYKRSFLGPFWITVSTFITVACMGPLYNSLLGQSVANYIPYLAISLVIWYLIQSILNESCFTFINSEQLIKQTRIPLTLHAIRMTVRNLFILFHNSIIICLVIIIFKLDIKLIALIYFMIGLLLIFTNGICMGLLLGAISARYRDMPQIISSLTQLVFFTTPIIWSKEMLGDKSWLADINPVYQFIQILRQPLLEGNISYVAIIYTITFSILNIIFTLLIFSKCRHKISYWI